ncbi:hypothetical protein BDN67DRAFT_659517 [Paxillus ammoniavirescens]|nr:hypothetical protein BDN67DRAFT_659517 [Paxillus ammoniavirescens]
MVSAEHALPLAATVVSGEIFHGAFSPPPPVALFNGLILSVQSFLYHSRTGRLNWSGRIGKYTRMMIIRSVRAITTYPRHRSAGWDLEAWQAVLTSVSTHFLDESRMVTRWSQPYYIIVAMWLAAFRHSLAARQLRSALPVSSAWRHCKPR